MAIQSFADRTVEEFFFTGKIRKRVGWSAMAGVVARKLDMVHYAHRVDDLRSPPGNRLEALKGPWESLYSIRINDQWRVVFQWTSKGPTEVDIVDYH